MARFAMANAHRRRSFIAILCHRARRVEVRCPEQRGLRVRVEVTLLEVVGHGSSAVCWPPVDPHGHLLIPTRTRGRCHAVDPMLTPALLSWCLVRLLDVARLLSSLPLDGITHAAVHPRLLLVSIHNPSSNPPSVFYFLFADTTVYASSTEPIWCSVAASCIFHSQLKVSFVIPYNSCWHCGKTHLK